jgi:hypothetical protein
MTIIIVIIITTQPIDQDANAYSAPLKKLAPVDYSSSPNKLYPTQHPILHPVFYNPLT